MGDEAVPDDPYADRYGATYSLYGDFDVDALLTACRPRSPFRVWRAGDPSPLGRLAKSSGVSIDIADDRKTIEPAVLRFLFEERAFLEAASTRTSAVWSVLTCRMFVYAAVESGITFTSATIQALAAAGVDVQIQGYPCADLDGP